METNCTWHKNDGQVRGEIKNFMSSHYGSAKFFITIEETHKGEAGLYRYAGVPSFMLAPDDNVKTVTHLARDIIDNSITNIEHPVSDFEWYTPDVYKREMGQ